MILSFLLARPVRAATQIAVDTTSDNAAASACTSAPLDCSVRGAVTFANNNADTTIFIPAGTYILTLGELVIGNSATTNTTINGAGASVTVIQQSSSNSRIFAIDPLHTSPQVLVNLTGLRLTGGKNPSDGKGGGGVLAGGANQTVNLSNCIFENNSDAGGAVADPQPAGGAIAFTGGGFLNVSNCSFSNNIANHATLHRGTGGAIAFQLPDNGQPGGLNITNSIFTGNQAGANGVNGAGGAINIVNTTTTSPHAVTVVNNTFANNQAIDTSASPFGRGGAIASASSNPLTVRFNRFVGNLATGVGSGIYQASSAAGSIDATLNWWGCNAGADNGGCDGANGNITVNPRLFLTFSATPNPVSSGSITTLTASFLTDSAGNPVALSNLSPLIGLPLTFGNPVLGTLTSAQTAILANGTATALFTAGSAGGSGSATATLDNATVTANISIQQPPVVTSQPTNQAVCSGTKVNFAAAASGVPAPTLQWQVSSNAGASFTDISGATVSPLTFTVQNTDKGKQYRARFSNPVGVATSQAATLTLDTAPVITLQPASQVVLAGRAMSLTVAASMPPTYTVQWQVSTDQGSHWNNLPLALAPTLVFTPTLAENNYQYRARLINLCGTTNSKAATLTVNAAPVVTTQPLTQYVNAGQTVNFTTAATGKPTPTLQWQVSVDHGLTWSNLAKATTSPLSFKAQSADNGKQYRALFSNSVGNTPSNSAELVIKITPTLLTQPGDRTVNAGQVVSFTAAASGSPSPTVQWEFSSDQGATWQTVAGAITPTLSFVAEGGAHGRQYHAFFSNLVGTATSSAAHLTVNTPPLVTLAPTDQAVNAGQPVLFSAAASSNPLASVQWQVSIDQGINWSDLAGAITPTLTLTAQYADDGKQYRAEFRNVAGSATSQAATLMLNLPPIITSQPSGQVVRVGQAVSFNAAASGRPQPLVQWQVSADGASWNELPGATLPTLTFTAPSTATNNLYRVLFSNVAGVATSDAAALSVVVNAAPLITAQPLDQTVCERNNVIFLSTATGTPPPGSQWQVSNDQGQSWHDLLGATAQVLLFTAQRADNGNQYRVLYLNTTGKATSTAATLTVNSAPTVISAPSSQTAEVGQVVTFTAASNAPGATVQWEVSSDKGQNWQPVSGAITPTLSFTAQIINHGRLYRAVFTHACGTVSTSAATLTLNLPSATDTTPPETVIHTMPLNPSNSLSATFTFSGTDNLTPAATLTFECKLDYGLFGICQTNGAQSYRDLSSGSHTFQVRAIDTTGNVDQTPVLYTWLVSGSLQGQVGQCGSYALLQDAEGNYVAPGWTGAVIVGTGGNDTLRGTANADLLLGLGGDDLLLGLAGDDLLCGGAGADRLAGGQGDYDQLWGDEGADQLFDADGVAAAHGGSDDDQITIGLRSGWRDRSGQPRFVNALTGGYQNDVVTLQIQDKNGFLLYISGDEADVPASTLEGSDDRLTLQANLTADLTIIKFENPQIAPFQEGLEKLTPPSWATEARGSAVFLALITR